MPAAGATPSLRVQRVEIQHACRRLGLELVEVCRDEAGGGSAVGRSGFERALREIHAGGANCLVVSGLAQGTLSCDPRYPQAGVPPAHVSVRASPDAARGLRSSRRRPSCSSRPPRPRIRRP